MATPKTNFFFKKNGFFQRNKNKRQVSLSSGDTYEKCKVHNYVLRYLIFIYKVTMMKILNHNFFFFTFIYFTYHVVIVFYSYKDFNIEHLVSQPTFLSFESML